MSANCPLCYSGNIALITNRLRFDKKADVYSCKNCTLVFLDQNSFSFPKNFYEVDYHQTYLTHVDPDMLDPQKHFEKMLEASEFWINKIRGLLKGDEEVLDVGCSTGHVMVGIKDAAKNVFGSELSKKEVEYCSVVLGMNVSDAPLRERFSSQRFDLITLIFVLEHIGDPITFLKELKRYLKLAIVVPNIMDPLVSLYAIPEFLKFYYCIEHLYYYSPKTLQLVLDMAGYEGVVESIQEYPIGNHVNWTYRHKPSETLAARAIPPNIQLSSSADDAEWTNFWGDINERYKNYLSSQGYGDRIWAVAKVKNEN